MEKIIYLFRHGETDWNKAGKLQGTEDIQLNKTGREQAKIIAKILFDEKLEHIYSSPLKRAYETGKIVADTSKIEVEKINDLIEISFGDYSGKTKSNVREILGNDVFEGLFYSEAYKDMIFPNGDKKIDAINRFTDCVFDLVKNTKYKKIGIAAHGFVIRMFLLYQGFEVEKMNNCTVVKLIFNGNNVDNIKFLN